MDAAGLEIGDVYEITDDPPAPIPMPTGLSDQDDARAYLAQRFNGLFCPNCEQYWHREDALMNDLEDWSPGACPQCSVNPNEGGLTDPVRLQEFGQERPWLHKATIDRPAKGRFFGFTDLGALVGMAPLEKKK